MIRRTIWEFAAIAAVIAVTAAASAGETVNYSYDAKGRLVKVVRSGTVNQGVNASYGYDKADNRVSVNVSGSSNPPP
jgi:YD repeat-containing protein